MEKRFLVFLLLSFAIFTVNMMWLGPADPPPVAEGEGDGEGDEEKTPPADKTEAKTDGAKTRAKTEETGPEKTGPEKDPPPKEPPPKVAAPRAPQQYITLGSLDTASPYRMLVTLTNRGAAMVRAELNSPKYRDLHDRDGYLGHLALSDARAGCRVNLVGRGTPAAAAELQIGDVIVAINEEPVFTVEEFHEQLAQTKPGGTAVLAVVRSGKELVLSATLGRRPLDIVRPEAEYYQMREEAVPEAFDNSLLLTLARSGEDKLDEESAELTGLDLRDGNWEVGLRDDNGKWQAGSAAEDRVTFRQLLVERGLAVYKTYALAKTPEADIQENPDFPSYHLQLSVQVENISEQETTVAYQLDGPNGLPAEGWWYAYKISPNWSGGAGLRDFVSDFAPGEPILISPQTISEEIDEDEVQSWKSVSIEYVGVDAQYFSAVLVPADDATRKAKFAQVGYRIVGEVHAENKQLSNTSFRLTSENVQLAPGESLAHEFRLFLGPKRPDLMAAEEYEVSSLIYYGWFWWVAKPMLFLLHMFYFVVRNYGVAIIMLTILVRSCMFPLSKKQALGAQKMQEIQPEIKKIKEKFPKDMEKQMKAQRELFRKHGYNPMAGCLPVLVQLPIFIGLYRSLSVDIELRQASLFGEAIRWCANLSAPDMLLAWDGFMPALAVSWLGPFLNILPIFTITIWIVQQKMFMPPATDDQTAMQQKIMKYMMVFMGFMFFKVAAGLCLYFMASSLWSIAERKLLPKTKSATAEPATPVIAKKDIKPRGGKPGGGKSDTNGSSAAKRKKRQRRK